MASQSQSEFEHALGPSITNWQEPSERDVARMRSNAHIDMGWGQLIFGHTFADAEDLAKAICEEPDGRRNLALYLRDPHVLLSLRPDELFLDPSHTFRLHKENYERPREAVDGIIVRHLKTPADAQATMRIYATRNMVTCEPSFLTAKADAQTITYLVAESEATGRVVGTVTGVDHMRAFNDPENGSSLWCLAVDPQAEAPGVGRRLVHALVEYFFDRGRDFVDLSVMHDNEQAIALYEQIGFERVPAFCVKRKNPINEPLFLPSGDEAILNPYAKIIADEARRRGIAIDVIDPKSGMFRLTLGGRSVTCWESLTDQTSAIAFMRCDDKRLTHRVLRDAGLNVPEQIEVQSPDEAKAFLSQHKRVVVKPARGEQGNGVFVDLRDEESVLAAVNEARKTSPDVLMEALHEGEDLRVIVINGKVVAAAVRRPPVVTGTGTHTVQELVEKYNRRRLAATGGESKVPLDDETRRVIQQFGYDWTDTPPANATVRLRRAANLHTGGTIHDVTPEMHSALKRACEEAARALEIPVVGFDLIVPRVDGREYVFIEANERAGLANHEPQPTAERFLDHLFPQTSTYNRR